jgi:hypothetical protein
VANLEACTLVGRDHLAHALHHTTERHLGLQLVFPPNLLLVFIAGVKHTGASGQHGLASSMHRCTGSACSPQHVLKHKPPSAT